MVEMMKPIVIGLFAILLLLLPILTTTATADEGEIDQTSTEIRVTEEESGITST